MQAHAYITCCYLPPFMQILENKRVNKQVLNLLFFQIVLRLFIFLPRRKGSEAFSQKCCGSGGENECMPTKKYSTPMRIQGNWSGQTCKFNNFRINKTLHNNTTTCSISNGNPTPLNSTLLVHTFSWLQNTKGAPNPTRKETRCWFQHMKSHTSTTPT